MDDLTAIAETIIGVLEGEMTFFNERWFEMNDGIVNVTGIVQQKFKYTPQTYWNPPDHELISRTADFDEIIVSTATDERVLTLEELYFIEKQLDK
ncbi:hypothetical protein [uncultured Mediterranean phage]|nr:hypothetical protein [uncultured Mediterranean phage]